MMSRSGRMIGVLILALPALAGKPRADLEEAFLGAATPASGQPSPDRAACENVGTSLCAKVYDVVHSSWLAVNAEALIATPTRILLVVAVAVVARVLVNRAIRRLTETTAGGAVPTVLRPLRPRAASRG